MLVSSFLVNDTMRIPPNFPFLSSPCNLDFLIQMLIQTVILPFLTYPQVTMLLPTRRL